MRGSYDDLALEYYDAERHPTCANFREASRLLLRSWLRPFDPGTGTMVEVGAGMSLVAELAVEQNKPLGSLVLLDSSPRMLEYSARWIAMGACRSIASADDMGLQPGSIALIVSSLGDPYNTGRFWSQVESSLTPGGVAIFTTPSHDWVLSFRDPTDPDSISSAEFELRDGRHISVPSFVLPPEDQIALMRGYGLYVTETVNVPLSARRGGTSVQKT